MFIQKSRFWDYFDVDGAAWIFSLLLWLLFALWRGADPFFYETLKFKLAYLLAKSEPLNAGLFD